MFYFIRSTREKEKKYFEDSLNKQFVHIDEEMNKHYAVKPKH